MSECVSSSIPLMERLLLEEPIVSAQPPVCVNIFFQSFFFPVLGIEPLGCSDTELHLQTFLFF